MPYAGLPEIGLVLHNKTPWVKQVEDGGGQELAVLPAPTDPHIR